MRLTQELRRSNKHLLFKSLSSEGSFLCSHVYPIQTLSKSEIFLSLDSFDPHMQNGNIILTPHRTVVSIPLMAALTETRQLRKIYCSCDSLQASHDSSVLLTPECPLPHDPTDTRHQTNEASL